MTLQWTFSDIGVERTNILAKNLFSTIKKHVEKNLEESFPKYLPWMSNTDKIEELKHTFTFSSDSIVANNPALLSSLASHLRKPSRGPIRRNSKIFVNTSYSAGSTDEKIYNNAFSLVCSSCPLLSKLASQLCQYIVPALATENAYRKDGVGFTSHYCKGAIFLSVPDTKDHADLELAINISHEIGHSFLIVYQSSNSIIQEHDILTPVYSVIRDQERPAIQSFHALTALVFMRYFTSKALNNTDLKAPQKMYLAKRYYEIIEQMNLMLPLFKNIDFTDVGLSLYRDYQLFAQQAAKHENI